MCVTGRRLFPVISMFALVTVGCGTDRPTGTSDGGGSVDGATSRDGGTAPGDACFGTCVEPARPDGSVFNPGHPWSEHLSPFGTQDPFTDVVENGTFRIKCSVSHLNYDDPIVNPGMPGLAHLHTYFGNIDADYRMNTENARSARGSTCHGGPLNLSAYWTPTVLRPLYEMDGERYVTDGRGNFVPTGEHVVVFPTDSYVLDDNGVPLRDGSGNAIENDNLGPDIYYKRATLGEISPMPDGLRMIAGDHSATPRRAQPIEIIRWACHEESDDMGITDKWRSTIPECHLSPDPDRVYRLHLGVFFPPCWDGVNLDVSDHKSHMAYPVFDGSDPHCPPSHPVALPQVSYQLFYEIRPDTAGPYGDTRDWFLSSDEYVAEPGEGGASAHGDWFMAWDREVVETWTRFCINEERHCANGDLGNGFRLSSLLPGRGNDEGLPVINRGHGEHYGR